MHRVLGRGDDLVLGPVRVRHHQHPPIVDEHLHAVGQVDPILQVLLHHDPHHAPLCLPRAEHHHPLITDPRHVRPQLAQPNPGGGQQLEQLGRRVDAVEGQLELGPAVASAPIGGEHGLRVLRRAQHRAGRGLGGHEPRLQLLGDLGKGQRRRGRPQQQPRPPQQGQLRQHGESHVVLQHAALLIDQEDPLSR